MKALPETDSVSLDARTLLVVHADGRSWLAAIDTATVAALPASRIARSRAGIAAGAIEGAIYAGLTRARTPRQGRRHGVYPTRKPAPPCTLHRYVKWLAGNATFAAQTPGLFREAAQRFSALGRPDLARHAARKADEEDGHAALALADLAALGLPATVVDALRPPSAAAFIERFQSLVRSEQPIALFGFSYCMERMALKRDSAFVGAVRAVLPEQVRALRFLTVHSALGSDAGHVVEQLAFFEGCTRDELHCVVRAAFETAGMLAQQGRMDRTLTSGAIVRRIHACGVDPDWIDRAAPGSTNARTNTRNTHSGGARHADV